MARAAKKSTPVWYGYLEAGARSSPVIRDDRLDTGNRKTVYLFNLARNSILEYARDIVEPKLRELRADESDTVTELDSAFKKARRGFKDRGADVRNLLKRGSGRGASNAAVYDIPPDEDDNDSWAEDDED